MIREEIVVHGCYDCPCPDTEEMCCGFQGGPLNGPLFIDIDQVHGDGPPPKDCPLRACAVMLILKATTP
jgi:hypothetical protein